VDARLQEMLDHHEIGRTLAEYCQGADRVDEAAMRGVYVEDSWDDHGLVKAPGPEFARVMSSMISETSEIMYHLLGQSLINIQGDEAGAETYFFAVSREAGDGGTPICNFLGGRFADKLVREGEGWKIKHRVVVRDWTLSLPVTNEWVGALSLTAGQRSGADPALAVLGVHHSGPPAPMTSLAQ
jgi:hypothetical protein